jgi:hypothetical protein
LAITPLVPQPPARPAEAPPRPGRAAKLGVKETPPASRRPPQGERTAALPPPNKSAPEPDPTAETVTAATPPEPSACQLRLTPDLAAVRLLRSLIGPGQCYVEDVVRLDAVIAPDGRRVAISPPAMLRCPMAEAVVHWIRDDVTSIAQGLGAPLKSLGVDTSFECRSRNRVAGAKLSEHGHANAIDLRGLTLATGKVIGLTDSAVDRGARERLRETACARFTTVLGPGSDGYHENHIHLDAIERRGGYRMCQWDVRDPKLIAGVPMPPERPDSAPPRVAGQAKSRAR